MRVFPSEQQSTHTSLQHENIGVKKCKIFMQDKGWKYTRVFYIYMCKNREKYIEHIMCFILVYNVRKF